jgi:hypothetical protein
MPTRASNWLLLLSLPLGFCFLWQLQLRLDRERAAIHEERDEVVVQSGKVVKWMSLEYAPFMADVYWTRAVQYYGAKRKQKDADVEMLWPLLDVTTTLDPQLIIAYRFGTIFLSAPAPRGAGRPDLAVELLQRGIQNNPAEWRLYQDLGFIYYWELKDYKKASEAFYEGSKNPASYVFMKVLAAKIAAEGESLETSSFIWRQVYDSSADPQVKKNAQAHLRILQTQFACREIDKVADEFEQRIHHRATQIKELVDAGMLKGVPRDPAGYPYELGEGGKAQVNLQSPLVEEILLDKPMPTPAVK